MVGWNDPQVKLAVYLIYGTSFILMFLVLTIWRNRVSHIEFPMKNSLKLRITLVMEGDMGSLCYSDYIMLEFKNCTVNPDAVRPAPAVVSLPSKVL